MREGSNTMARRDALAAVAGTPAHTAEWTVRKPKVRMA